jgi:hypothetical protein
MTTFDDRQRNFENKYAHDEELAFKINARRFKLLGQWAAALLGKGGAEAETYAQALVMADFEMPGHDDVVLKLVQDFAQTGVKIGEKDIRVEMERLLSVAREQVMKG